MSTRFSVLLLIPLFAVAATAQVPTAIPNGLPSWAFNIPDAVQHPTQTPSGRIRVPGSSCEYDWALVAGNANPPDWFPEEHGPAPRSVKGEAGATIQACGSCHLMSGQEHPESADIAGLPAEYIVRQMKYFKSGARKDEGRMGPIARGDVGRGGAAGGGVLRRDQADSVCEGDRNGDAAEDLRGHRRAPSCRRSGRWHGGYRPSHYPDTGRCIPDNDSRSTLAVSRVRAARFGS